MTLLSDALLKDLYRQMLRIRLVEEMIARFYPEEEMRCPVHLCVGQEATSAGVCAALEPRDIVFSGHRSHGHYLAKGGNLEAMLAELYGKRTGCSKGRGGSMHLVDRPAGFYGSTPIVGSTIPIAVGAAMASAARREGRVSVVFFGDAAAEEGVFCESLNFASLKKLPVIFVCENNLYSVYSPLEVRRPKGTEIIEIARAHGMSGRSGDGNDVSEVFRLAAEAVGRARRGEGPCLIEFKTYRWLEHCGPGDDSGLGYRSPEELTAWKEKCPVERVRRKLLTDGLADESELLAWREAILREIESAFLFARQSPFPEPSELMEGLYA